MSGEDRDGAAVRIPPPLVYVGGILLGALLHAFVLPLPLGIPVAVRIAATSVAAVAGVLLMWGAAGLFRRTGQDPKPWKSTPEILSTGVYRHTRNPMYVSMGLLQAAVGIGLANAWIVVLVVPVLVVVRIIAIRHEEAYLERKFGETYREYRATVRRWL